MVSPIRNSIERTGKSISLRRPLLPCRKIRGRAFKVSRASRVLNPSRQAGNC
jgi:hypothetical protein